jgi:hypothetical protein
MADRKRGAGEQCSRKPIVDARAGDEPVGLFEEWERYPADRAERNVRYQEIARYVPGAGVSGLSLFVLAAAGDGLKMLARGVIRLLMR